MAQDQNKAAQTQIIRREGSQASQKGPAEYFTGTARIDPLFPVQDGSNVSAVLVTFEPGADAGWTQCEGDPKKDIRAGDVVTCPCNRRHWHGATATTAMRPRST